MRETPFKQDSESGKALLDWWTALQKDPGERAELRRCHTLNEAVLTPAYQRLRIALIKTLQGNEEGLAAVAGLLAHVKSPQFQPIARQMAEKKNDKPVVSESRFRRLLKAKDQRELFIAMKRVLHLLDGNADLYTLAQAAYFWNERTRRDWANDYYLAALG